MMEAQHALSTLFVDEFTFDLLRVKVKVTLLEMRKIFCNSAEHNIEHTASTLLHFLLRKQSDIAIQAHHGFTIVTVSFRKI